MRTALCRAGFAVKPPPKEAVDFTGALPPKVAPQPRNGVYLSAAASRRVTESDDEFSDGLRGGMRCEIIHGPPQTQP